MFNNFDDDFSTGMTNPIFKIMGEMGSPIIEEEIQNHKNKLNNLITKLINTHNIDNETSINNEIKNETEFLSSLFKIKRNELNQKNNNININPMQQQMGQMGQMNPQMGQMNPQMMDNNGMDMQQQMMQQQMIQQQMMQQQMMQQQQMLQQQMMQQQQMMAAQAAQAQQAEMKNILNKPIKTGMCVIFRQSGLPDDSPKNEPIFIYGCYPDQKVSSIIEQYRSKSGDYSSKKFIFNAKNLSPLLTVAEAGISNNANIFVVKTK